MANSYIIQGTNVICTNMQVSEPLKIGVSRTSPNIIHTGKTQYYLTEADRKISESFKCKMAAKKWGGLAMLCAGLAIGGAILLTVATGGVAAVILAGVCLAATGTVGALAIGVYNEAHDCDITLETPWIDFHKTVRFQGKNALLNSSTMNCPQGGVVTIIVDPVIAQNAAGFLSNNNRKEITAQASSKFGVGLIGGLTGGANIPGVALAIGFDIWFEEGKSQRLDLAEEAKEFAIEEGTGLGVDVVQEGYEIAKVTQHNQAVTNQMRQFSTDAFEAGLAGNTSRQASRELAADIASRSFKDYDALASLKNIGVGLGGAIAGFALEQSVNKYEYNLYVESRDKLDSSDDADENNNIGVIATDT